MKEVYVVFMEYDDDRESVCGAYSTIERAYQEVEYLEEEWREKGWFFRTYSVSALIVED